MSLIFPHVMTWFHKTGTNSFDRTVVQRVMWQASKTVNTVKSGLLDSDKAIVYVPFLDDEGDDRSADLIFKAQDYLVPDEVPEELDANFTPTKLLAKYPEAIQIRSVDRLNYGPMNMQHIEIGGK